MAARPARRGSLSSRPSAAAAASCASVVRIASSPRRSVRAIGARSPVSRRIRLSAVRPGAIRGRARWSALPAVFRLRVCFRLPLHVARRVRAAARKWDDVIDHVPRPAVRIPSLLFESGFRLFASCNPAVCVSCDADGLLGADRLKGRAKGNKEGNANSESHGWTR